MAQSINSYKTYERERRRITVQSAFNLGMRFTNGAIDEGYVKSLVNYDLSNDGVYLIPRPGLRAETLIAPDWEGSVLPRPSSDTYWRVVDCKECVEADGKVYRQFVIAERDAHEDYYLRLFTVPKELDLEVPLEYAEKVGIEEFNVLVNNYTFSTRYPCEVVERTDNGAHGWKVEDSDAFDIIGTFAFGNSYYWFNEGVLYKSKFDSVGALAERYWGEAVPVKSLGASEVVLYGYNMLSETPYTFYDRAGNGKIELTGILPYKADSSFSELQMTPKQNERVTFRCYFEGEVGKRYKFVWEWRTVNDSKWTEIQDLSTASAYTIVDAGDGNVKLQDSLGNDVVLAETIKVPSSEVMIRVQAFDASNLTYVEEAMTMGFDFTLASYGATSNVEQKNYDLSTAKGMTVWNNRLVLYGVVDDPTILFISDLNEPGYFPYPNNITIYNEPIIAVKPFMGDLLVFTTSEIHRVSLGSDGVSFNDIVVQTHLYLETGDKRFIQIVKNMVFFKSGNYFYMMVPKAQTTTGTLTLAPISSNITEFFNKFEHNIYEILQDVYDYTEPVKLYDFYNYLDYDDVHNTYVFKYENTKLGTQGYLYIDLIYDTNLRNWRTYVFEATDYLRPYRYDSTQRGQLVGLTKLPVSQGFEILFIELFQWDALDLSDLRIFPEADFVFPSGETGVSGWTEEQLAVLNDLYTSSFRNSNSKKTFFNWQYLDTGYRNEFLEHMKRYREIQIQINNTDGVNLEFGMDFYLDNEVRMRWYDYEVEHIVDETAEDYGQLYVTRVETPNIKTGRNTTRLAGETGGWTVDSKSVWTLNQSQFPELSLWKIRMPVSGKGAAPRIKFVSQNEQRYELMTINWVCRVMNAR